MKPRDIENQLKNEIEKASTPNFAKLMERCKKDAPREALLEKELVPVTAGAPLHRQKTTRNAVTAIILAFLLVLTACFVIYFITDKDDLKNHSTSSSSKKGGYIVVDINPSLEIAYDKDGIVTKITPLNEDAEILLCDMNLIGKSYESAVDSLFDGCIELGYLSPSRQDNAVMTTVIGEDGAKDEEMSEKIKNVFNSEFSERKMLGVVITGFDDPELKDEADKYGIDTQKYSLIQRYLSLGGELEEERYSEISIRELYSYISEKEKEIKNEEIAQKENEANKLQNELFGKVIEDLKIIVEYLPEEAREPINSLILELEEIGKIESLEKLYEKLDELESKEDMMLYALVYGIKLYLSEAGTAIEKTEKELNELNKTVEEKKKERLESFGEVFEGNEEIDLEKWQKENEEAFKNGWYSKKDKWNDDRKNESSRGEKPSENNKEDLENKDEQGIIPPNDNEGENKDKNPNGNLENKPSQDEKNNQDNDNEQIFPPLFDDLITPSDDEAQENKKDRFPEDTDLKNDEEIDITPENTDKEDDEENRTGEEIAPPSAPDKEKNHFDDFFNGGNYPFH